MGFDDIAARMKQRDRPVSSALHEVWHGEAPAPLPDPLPVLATPEARRGALVAAYLVLGLGLAIALAGALVLLLWFMKFDRWERRGLYGVIGLGVTLVIKATTMFGDSDDA